MQITTLRQRAYRQLEQMLASGEIGPEQQLAEVALAQQFGMSRTPVREALRQMEMEGLLEYAPHFGAVVRRLDADELAEMYSVREALESHAAMEAAGRITPAQLERLAGLYRQMRDMSQGVSRSGRGVLDGAGLREFISADIEFHRIIVEASGNRFMMKILATTHLLERVFMLTNWVYDKPALAEANRFHGKILDALMKHDADGARRWTAEAMRVSKRNALAHKAAKEGEGH